MTDFALFTADLASPSAALKHPRPWCVGSGHATLALRADWHAQLEQARRDPGFRHVLPRHPRRRHGTVPFTQDAGRVEIAFDVAPQSVDRLRIAWRSAT